MAVGTQRADTSDNSQGFGSRRASAMVTYVQAFGTRVQGCRHTASIHQRRLIRDSAAGGHRQRENVYRQISNQGVGQSAHSEQTPATISQGLGSQMASAKGHIYWRFGLSKEYLLFFLNTWFSGSGHQNVMFFHRNHCFGFWASKYSVFPFGILCFSVSGHPELRFFLRNNCFFRFWALKRIACLQV